MKKWMAMMAAILMAIGLSSVASAQGFYIGPSLGYVGVQKSDIDPSFGYGVNLGYNFSENFALGFEWLQSKPTASDFDDVNIQLDTFSLMGRWSAPVGEAFHPYLEGGLSYNALDVSLENNGVGPTVSWNDNSMGYIVGAGVNIVMGNFYVMPGVTYNMVDSTDLDNYQVLAGVIRIGYQQ